MRVYPRALTRRDPAGWLGAWATTGRASPIVVVAGAGLALGTTCWGLARMPNLVLAPRAFLVLFTLAWLAYACGALVAVHLHGRVTVTVILTVGVLSRLLLLGAPPSLSTDAYRYVWDARVSSAGVDPYRYPPEAAEVAALRDASIYPKLNHSTWRTVYPPVAQAFFRAVYWCAPDSIVAMKLALGMAELLALAALALLLRTLDVPLGRLAIYAWNPLLLVEIWGSGHLDALVLVTVTAAALASARRRDRLAAVLLGIGTLVKLYPAVLLLVLPGRRRVSVWALFGAVLVAGTLATGGLGRWPITPIGRYLGDEYFNPGLVRTLADAPLLALAATAAWVLVVASRRRADSFAVRAVPMVAGFIVLGANVFPWYVVWLVPFLAITPSVPLIAFTGTVGFAYGFFLSEPWAIPPWARLVEAAPLAIAAAVKHRGVLEWLPGARARTGAE
jgi:alpha-1,6-mannosyltransferase